jgi:CRP-like cAMP-binding protein
MFTEVLKENVELADELKYEIALVTEDFVFKKNEYILKQGAVCEHLYYIKKGLLRGFYTKNDKDITNWFAAEGTLATSAYSFISKKSGFEGIVAVEDTELDVISRKSLYALYSKYPSLNEIGRRIIEIYYLELEERLNALQFQTARQRYKNFLKSEGHLIQRVSLGQIASYLGITQETLSRIRNQ